MKKLLKRVQDKELVVVPTDKSGRFSVMGVKTYLKAGNKHTNKDKEVNLEQIKGTQADLNGNMAMIIKFCRMGAKWNHGDRMRGTTINGSENVCPMYLSYKDHKGWTGTDGKPAPTRPIASGNVGMNIHISEVVSEIIEPVVDSFEGGNEAISSEDLMASLMGLNEEKLEWEPGTWWVGKSNEDGNIITCGKCWGNST